MERLGVSGLQWMTEKPSIEAYDLKAEAGRYERDWKGDVKLKEKDINERIQQSVRRFGIRYASTVELAGSVPHDTVPSLVHGFLDPGRPDRLRLSLTCEPRSQPSIEWLKSRGLKASETPRSTRRLPST